MERVSCRTVSVTLRALEARSLPIGHLVEGLEVDLATLLDPRATLGWDDFCVLHDRIESAVGGPEALVEVGRLSSDRSLVGSLMRSLGFAVSPRQLYQLGFRWHGANFPHTRASSEEIGASRLRIVVEIPEPHLPSLAFFRVLQGVLESTPRLIGLSDSIIEAQLTPRRGEYLVTLPPQHSLLGRLRRTFEVFGSSASAIDELSEQHERIKRSVDELRLSEERYRRLTENADDLVAEWDLSGRCIYASPSIERILGWTRAEFMENPYALLHPDEGAQTREALMGRLTAGGSGELQFRLRNRSGEWHWFENRSHAVEDRGEVSSLVTVSRDVTERLALEEQLRQSQKMEAVGQLAGGVAHDFNNLLTVISGYCEILREDLDKDGEPYQAALNIDESAEKATALTRQLLAFSRRQTMRPVVVDLNEVVRSMERMLRRVIGEDIELVSQLAPELGRIHADPTQMEQVVLNLAVNARDAMPAGGRLTIETTNVEDAPQAPDGPDAGRFVELRIRDTGVGIPADVQPRIFEPFFTTKELGLGSGLGLSTAYGILRQSGGEIHVESAPSAGTEFRIRFPCTELPAEPHDDEAALVDEPGGDETILLVEDDDSVRRVAQTGLERFGYRVLAASGASQALGLAEAHGDEIALLLTDVVMPELSGPELARRIQDLLPGSRLLFMSGYPDHLQNHGSGLRSDENLIMKPFRNEILARKVRQLLDADPG